jgi:hypothetical protein
MEALLTAANIDFRHVRSKGSEGFLLTDLPPDATVEGIAERDGLFLLAERNADAVLASAAPGCRIVESGTLRLGKLAAPIHRYVKPGEPARNLSARAQWFQQRLK